MKRNTAIFGTGEAGRNIFYKLRGKENIVCWYDKENFNDKLYHLEIKKYEMKNDDEKIIVADSNWLDICTDLKNRGLEIIDGYIPYWLYNKKMIPWRNFLSMDAASIERCLLYLKKTRGIAIIYGNCQTEIIQRYFAESQEFISKYIIINIPRVCQEDHAVWKDMIESKIFSFCDLFIYQIVLENNRFGSIRSTSNILKLLQKDCIKVSIPNIYFDGYFPQIEKNPYNILEDVQEDGLFKWGDKFVNKLLLAGTDENHIIGKILDEDFLSDEEVQRCVKASFENLQKREERTDIKISDYVKKHFKERQLFFAPNHPNNELLLECSVRVLSFLGMDRDIKTEPVDSFVSLMGEDIVLYPSVAKRLGLKHYYKSFFPNRYIEHLAYSAADYYKLYCESIGYALWNEKNKTT